MSKNPQLQFFQAAFVILALACLLLSPQASSSTKVLIPTASRTCPEDLRVVQLEANAVLNLRAKPNGEILNQLAPGQVVFVDRYDRTSTWAKIVLSDSTGTRREDRRGWVLNQYLVNGTGCPNSLG